MKPLVVAFALVASVAGPAAASVEGRWVLTEQTYQDGGRNLAPDEAPVRIEFTSGPAGITGRVWAGEDDRTASPWPSIVVEGRALPVAVRSVSRTASGGVAALYTAVPAEGSDMVLEIRETYEPEGDGIAGTVEVRFTGGERNRGGYTLHRRFERER